MRVYLFMGSITNSKELIDVEEASTNLSLSFSSPMIDVGYKWVMKVKLNQQVVLNKF